MIRLDGVTKTYSPGGLEIRALSDVQLEIRRGDYVSIAGPSGCGKSTLLSILGLLDTPSAGRYEFEGIDVRELSVADRALVRNLRIGFIFQSFNLIGGMSVFDNVALPLSYRRVPARVLRERVQLALERVGMTHRMNHFPSQLSGGQQQRVAVGRAIVGDPAVLLADEPTGNLDSNNGEMVMDLLGELHRGGVTICMVTHDPRYARDAERTIYLFDGRVVEDEPNTPGFEAGGPDTPRDHTPHWTREFV
ncbi:MAG TPA: ABC transporter ATP-binding protein [Thermoanaerobaculia bacterium]